MRLLVTSEVTGRTVGRLASAVLAAASGVGLLWLMFGPTAGLVAGATVIVSGRCAYRATREQ